jgi:hypothetical protein
MLGERRTPARHPGCAGPGLGRPVGCWAVGHERRRIRNWRGEGYSGVPGTSARSVARRRHLPAHIDIEPEIVVSVHAARGRHDADRARDLVLSERGIVPRITSRVDGAAACRSRSYELGYIGHAPSSGVRASMGSSATARRSMPEARVRSKRSPFPLEGTRCFPSREAIARFAQFFAVVSLARNVRRGRW